MNGLKGSVMKAGNGLRERLLKVFRDEFGDLAINEQISTATYSAWDSLAHIKLLIAIEREFAFEPSPEEISEMYSDFRTVEGVLSRKLPQP